MRIFTFEGNLTISRYQKGLGTEKNNDEAERLLRISASEGHNRAKFRLASLLHRKYPDSVARLGEAAALYRDLSRGGDNVASLHLGFMFDAGIGVKEDKFKAFKAYERAARQGNVEAYYHLATYYHTGITGVKSLDKAIEYYGVASDNGNLDANHSLALMHLKGEIGAGKDEKEGERRLRLGAEKGHLQSMISLARLLRLGNRTDGEYAEALKYLNIAVMTEEASLAAYFGLAHMYAKGLGVERDTEEAIRLYRLSSRDGDKSSLFYLAKLLILKPDADSKSEACRIYKNLADNGHHLSQYNLGMLLRFGEGVEEDWVEALRYFTLAKASGKHLNAMSHLFVCTMSFGDLET